jgi:hypothetical protein
LTPVDKASRAGIPQKLRKNLVVTFRHEQGENSGELINHLPLEFFTLNQTLL